MWWPWFSKQYKTLKKKKKKTPILTPPPPPNAKFFNEIIETIFEYFVIFSIHIH